MVRKIKEILFTYSEKMEIKRLLFLDDYRNPFDKKIDWMVFSPIGRNVEINWVKTHHDFIEWIKSNGIPDGICFDHDLDQEHYLLTSSEDWEEYYIFGLIPSGFDSAKWLCDYCFLNDISIPPFTVHSANKVGKLNIENYISNFKQTYNL